jgi:hypothetical protein
MNALTQIKNTQKATLSEVRSVCFQTRGGGRWEG